MLQRRALSLSLRQNGAEVEEVSPQSLPPPSAPAHTFFVRKTQGSLGLSIVTAKVSRHQRSLCSGSPPNSALSPPQGSGQLSTGVFVKAVVGGGSASRDGRLAPGDQLLEVDGTPLAGLSQEEAAALIQRTGEVVRLTVVKDAAQRLGIQQLIEQGTPVRSPTDARGTVNAETISPTRAPAQQFAAPAAAPAPGMGRATGVRSPDLFPPRHQITVPYRQRPESSMGLRTALSPPPGRESALGMAPNGQGRPALITRSTVGPERQSRGSVDRQENFRMVSRAPEEHEGFAARPQNGLGSGVRPQSRTEDRNGFGRVSRSDQSQSLLWTGVRSSAPNGAGTAPPLPPYPKRLGGPDARRIASQPQTEPRSTHFDLSKAFDSVNQRVSSAAALPPSDSARRPFSPPRDTFRPSNYVNLSMSPPSGDPVRRRLPASPNKARPTPSRSYGELRSLRASDGANAEFSTSARLPSARSEHDLEAQRIQAEFEARLRAEEALEALEEPEPEEVAAEVGVEVDSSARHRLATLQRLLGDMEARKRQREDEDRQLKEKQEELDRLAEQRWAEGFAGGGWGRFGRGDR